MDQPTGSIRAHLARLFPRTPRGMVVCTGLIALGFLQSPRDWFVWETDIPSSPWAWFVYGLSVAAQLSPLLCFIVALLVARGRMSLPPGMAGWLGVLILPIGLVLTPFVAYFSGGGETLVLIHGGLVTLAISGTLLWTGWHRQSTGDRTVAAFVLLIPTTAAILSLAGAAWISIAAFHIAGGARHCLARSDDGPAPIDGLWDLRIFAFYTTGSGYKNTSRWYFHGLLVVDAPGGREVYNWSPRRLRFDRLQRPDIFIHNVREACEP